MRPDITNRPEELQSLHCKLSGNLWGRFDLYFDQPIGKNLYRGRQEASQEEVWVKEYLLNDMVDARRYAFQQLIDLNLKLGKGPDFRLVQLKDFATTQQACYLISQPLTGAEPLSQYLSAPLSPYQVKRVLQQCLETLRYLHTACCVLWPTGSERGLCHGNLSLDSLWIRPVQNTSHEQTDNFFIYVTDLALWEHIFWANRPIAKQAQDLGSIRNDLNDLGNIGIALLLGRRLTNTADTAQILCSIENQSPDLAAFLHRLTASMEKPLRTTEEALQALRDLPELSRQPVILPKSSVNEVVTAKPAPKFSGAHFKQTAGVAMGVLGTVWLGYSAVQQWQLRPSSAIIVTASYLLEPQGTWHSILQQPGENNNFIDVFLEDGHSLQPAKPLAGRPDQITRRDIFDQLLEGQADFALMDNDEDIPAGLQVHPVAYDAIVPFVAFSNDNQAYRATTFIGDSISLTQLRQVFKGEIDTVNGALVQAYFPEVPYVKTYPSQLAQDHPPKVKFSTRPPLFDRFYQQVLGEDPEVLMGMEQVLEKTRLELRSHIQNENGLGNYDIFTNVNRAFNQWNVLDDTSEPVIGIGYDRLSRVRQQCDVYPLAIEQEGRQIQLFQQNSKAINPRIDLCQNTVQPNITLIQQLAIENLLAYELVLVYPETSKTGAAVAELFNHQESQDRFRAIGIIPVANVNP